MALVQERALPTSFGSVKSGVKSSARTATGVMWLVLGVGLFLFALPFLSRIPILGQILARGVSVLPNQSASGASMDGFGTIVGA